MRLSHFSFRNLESAMFEVVYFPLSCFFFLNAITKERTAREHGRFSNAEEEASGKQTTEVLDKALTQRNEAEEKHADGDCFSLDGSKDMSVERCAYARRAV